MNNPEVKRAPVDRRSGQDRRKSYSLDYFAHGGIERRKGKERRQGGERRSEWSRVSKWYSIYIGS